eukprot:403343705
MRNGGDNSTFISNSVSIDNRSLLQPQNTISKQQQEQESMELLKLKQILKSKRQSQHLHTKSRLKMQQESGNKFGGFEDNITQEQSASTVSQSQNQSFAKINAMRKSQVINSNHRNSQYTLNNSSLVNYESQNASQIVKQSSSPKQQHHKSKSIITVGKMSQSSSGAQNNRYMKARLAKNRQVVNSIMSQQESDVQGITDVDVYKIGGLNNRIKHQQNIIDNNQNSFTQINNLKSQERIKSAHNGNYGNQQQNLVSRSNFNSIQIGGSISFQNQSISEVEDGNVLYKNLDINNKSSQNIQNLKNKAKIKRSKTNIGRGNINSSLSGGNRRNIQQIDEINKKQRSIFYDDDQKVRTKSSLMGSIKKFDINHQNSQLKQQNFMTMNSQANIYEDSININRPQTTSDLVNLNSKKSILTHVSQHKKSISTLTRQENDSHLHKILDEYQPEIFAQKQKILLSPNKRKEFALLQMLQENVEGDSTDLIRSTNFEIKKAQMQLGRIIQGAEEIAIVLNDRKHIEIECMPDFMSFVKIPIRGYSSPCIIHIKQQIMEQPKDLPKNQQRNFEIYLSSSTAQPSSKGHQFRYKNAHKITYYGPPSMTGINTSEVFKLDNLFIGIETDFYVKLTLSCCFKVDVQELEQKPKQKKRDALKSANPLSQASQLNGGPTSIYDPDSFTLKGRTRKQIQLDLQRKIALFMNDHGKRAEFFAYLQELKHKKFESQDPEDINKYLLRNLDLAQQWLDYSKERRLLLVSYENKKHERAEERRKQLDQEYRKSKIMHANRWIIYRQNQEKLKIEMANLSQEMQRKAMLITLIAQHQIMKRLYHDFDRNRKQILRRGETRQLRIRETLKQCFSFKVTTQYDNNYSQSQTIVHAFLKQYMKKATIKNKFVQYYEKIISIQQTFTRVLHINKARMILLKKYFDEVHQKVLLTIIKKKKDKSKLFKLQNISHDVKEAVLLRYFNKCKIKHASQFFEWRRKRHQVKVKRSIETILNLRRKDQFMDEAQRHKLMQFGVEGLAQIEEKRLRYENLKPIESLTEIEQREILETNYNQNYQVGAASKSNTVQPSSRSGAKPGQQLKTQLSTIQQIKTQKQLKQQKTLQSQGDSQLKPKGDKDKQLLIQKVKSQVQKKLDTMLELTLSQNQSQQAQNSNVQDTFLTSLTGASQIDHQLHTQETNNHTKSSFNLLSQEKDEQELFAKLFKEISNLNIIIDEDFWNPPQIKYWPSLKMMKDLINIACNTKNKLDLIF